ncbi:MAG: TrbG/VirB9 family P-type conjugative transfer protein [Alphaproteobacteria bacterium]|nr:TrbG/VirB9 family P-type conjugative transfer protein [Alphaproteobacteria bacterium]
MRICYKSLILTIIGMLFATNSLAGLVDDADQSANQQKGNYQPMNMSYAGFNSLGMIQSAWQDPLQNLGEGQSKPAYSKYYWSPDLVLPIRLRESMLTLINFPEWELVEEVMLGDSGSFSAELAGPNSVILYPVGGTAVGVDTNMVIFGRSGNKYVFYVKSEGFNTERLTNSIIDIDVVSKGGASGGGPSSSSGVLGGGSGRIGGSAGSSGSSKSVDSTYTKRFLKEDWLKSIPLDPTKFRFDIEIYVPNPEDVVIAPERVWHDDIFTYIDLGEKALNMVQRPVVTLIVERVETPVGFRAKGPNNRLIIVEGIGDMVMRSGKRMVCLKMRRSDDDGLQYVSYHDEDNAWDVGPKIPGGQSANGSNSSSATGNSATGSSGEQHSSDNSGNEDLNGIDVTKVDASGGITVPNQASASAFFIGDESKGNSSANGGSSGNMYNITMPKSDVMMTDNGMAIGIDYDHMTKIDRSSSGNVQNPYPQYKFGSGFAGSDGENLSIELGTDSNVNNLETLWRDLSGRYSSLLGGYEPFYSVDTPADGQGKELFHLRVGPVKSLDGGDAICSQLGRNGVFCSVVRMQ